MNTAKKTTGIFIFLLLIHTAWTNNTGSVKSGSSLEINAEDTTFRRTDPSLIYTTREFFFDAPAGTYGDKIFIKDFEMILVFNVGINSRNQIKQIGFKKAILDFNVKGSSSPGFATQKFSKYNSEFSDATSTVKLTFFPDRASKSSVSPEVQKCIFNGTVHDNGVTGDMLVFTPAGDSFHIQFNPY